MKGTTMVTLKIFFKMNNVIILSLSNNFLQATGLAIGYAGSSLLMLYVAYLSPWIPPWLWISVGVLMVTGVFITAVGTSGAIGTMAGKATLRRVVSFDIFSAYIFYLCTDNWDLKVINYSA